MSISTNLFFRGSRLLLLPCAVTLLTAACHQTSPVPNFDNVQWIGVETPDSLIYQDEHAVLPARYLQKEFTVKGKVREARLWVSAMGYYDCFLNQEHVSPYVFGNLPSQYDKTIYYNEYDVTNMIHSGSNILDATVYSGYSVGALQGMPVFGLPRLMAQLIIRTSQGELVISTDSTWMASDQGPVRISNLYDGELYDARIAQDGFLFYPTDVMTAPLGNLTPQPSPSMCIQDTVHPIAIWQISTNENNVNNAKPKSQSQNRKVKIAKPKFLLDMGQNMVGWLQLTGKGKTGHPVIMRFAESLLPDSSGIYTANLRDARCTNVYIPSSEEEFTYHPTTVDQGFRYVEIEGLTEQPSLDDIMGLVIYDQMEDMGSFECSNSLLNQLFEAAYWGIRSNYHGMPTDCPQRDERLGWLGDRMTGCHGESFLFNNHDLYLKWLQDMEDTQDSLGQVSHIAPMFWSGKWLYGTNVTWCGTYIGIAAMLLERYGDDTGIRLHYASMRKWVHFVIDDSMEDGIMTKDTYGDWCMPPENEHLIHSKDPNRVTEAAVLSTTVMYDLLGKMHTFAQIMNRPDDAAEYAALSEQMKTAYNTRFYNAEGGYYSNNTVTANILSYELGLVPESEKERVMKNIIDVTTNTFDSHVSCGVLGIQHLMRGLTRNGYADLAYTIATQTTYPSWGYMLENGATTIWELWNGNTANPAMNSGNHVMLLGDLLLWYMEDLAGIRPASNGYQTLLMQPYFPSDLNFVKASYNSPHGLITSEWNRQKDGQISWQISLPKGVTATVVLPNGDIQTIQGTQILVFS